MLLFRILLFLILFPFAIWAFRRIGTTIREGTRQTKPGSTVRDPTCGMFLDPESPTIVHEKSLTGETVYFCSAQCRDRYLAGPHS